MCDERVDRQACGKPIVFNLKCDEHASDKLAEEYAKHSFGHIHVNTRVDLDTFFQMKKTCSFVFATFFGDFRKDLSSYDVQVIKAFNLGTTSFFLNQSKLSVTKVDSEGDYVRFSLLDTQTGTKIHLDIVGSLNSWFKSENRDDLNADIILILEGQIGLNRLNCLRKHGLEFRFPIDKKTHVVDLQPDSETMFIHQEPDPHFSLNLDRYFCRKKEIKRYFPHKHQHELESSVDVFQKKWGLFFVEFKHWYEKLNLYDLNAQGVCRFLEEKKTDHHNFQAIDCYQFNQTFNHIFDTFETQFIRSQWERWMNFQNEVDEQLVKSFKLYGELQLTKPLIVHYLIPIDKKSISQ